MRTISTANLIAVAVIGVAFAAGFLSGPALAGEPQEVTPFEFNFIYNNNELASTEKAEKLLGRLENRVRDHCGGDRKMSLAERKFVTACVNDTMRQSVSKFGSEAVAQAYRSRAEG
jgi:UrcA family protein